MADLGYTHFMTTAAFEPSHNDPNLRPDMEPDGTPSAVPGLDVSEPDDVPSEASDPSQPKPTES
jgi:hypothetical protein